ncbi:MAG TPA: sigma-54 dependent transcriptional regulator [Anaeromyxobacteraceae bacterium]|nr:sigma-54 dependent transcriptional regulator [Anaeromyxobacteraceae bacterium]
MTSILIVDDEASLVASLAFALRGEGYAVESASTGEAGVAAAQRSHPGLVLLDLRLPDGSGLDFLDRIRAACPGVPVIMISAHGDTRAAVQAVRRGAQDYLTKPFELDDLFHAIGATLQRQRMEDEIARWREAEVSRGELVGESEPVRALLAAVRRVGMSGAARVLLLGESGTGKALVARAIHASSARSRGPFVEVNCASLPEHLIEAELFGAEKGAFTGAEQRRVGLVALADGGTLFLDEVGELPLPLQAKLLHFLENGTYRPIGAGLAQTADVRVIAATNRDLALEMRHGAFRQDLYYRLNVVAVQAPPLRERGDDVLLLARHFAERYGREERCAPVAFTPEAEAVLRAYRWPGNVRELRNLVERLTILGPGRTVTPADLPPEITARPGTASAGAQPAGEPRAIGEELADAERRLVEKALQDADGHRGRAASILGISRHALKRRLHRLGLG